MQKICDKLVASLKFPLKPYTYFFFKIYQFFGALYKSKLEKKFLIKNEMD